MQLRTIAMCARPLVRALPCTVRPKFPKKIPIFRILFIYFKKTNSNKIQANLDFFKIKTI